jgi:hypothetical protein
MWLLRELGLWLGDVAFRVVGHWWGPWGYVHRAYELDPDWRRWLVGCVSLVVLFGLMVGIAALLAWLF